MAGLGLFSLLGAWKAQKTLARDERELAASLAGSPLPLEIRRAALERIDRHPADYALYDIIGAFYSSGPAAQPKEALAFTNRALYLRPLDWEAHRVAARSLLKLGRRSQAALEYRLAYQAGPDQSATLDEAVAAARGLEELKQLVPNAPIPISHVAQRLSQMGRRKEARQLVAEGLKLLSSARDLPELWLLEAQFWAEEQQWDAALQALTEAEKGWPGSARVLSSRSGILWETGRRDEAIAVLESAFARHPDDLEVAFALANRLIAAKSPKRAREVLSRASYLASSPSSRSRWLMVEAISFQSEGQFARALQYYQSAARITPNQAETHYAVATVLEALKRPADAMNEVREGMKYDNPSGVQRASERLAQLERAQRELDGTR
jgi:tetratricopeptide (TPR) repeat protein